MGDSKIEWTDKTWNPVTGCTKVSQGCKHCYAERIAGRMWATQYSRNPDGTPRRFTDVRCHADRLGQPFTWRKPARVFVNSMSDLFHEAVHHNFIAQVFAVMAQTPEHTYQVLTKRPNVMYSLMTDPVFQAAVEAEMQDRAAEHGWCVDELETWPLPNVWLGTSVESQDEAEKRIPFLWQLPAAVRFLSCEPLLGPLNLGFALAYVDWVIVGGESGPGARPMRSDWVRDIRDQCQSAGVAFFFKQWGEHEINGQRIGKKAAGRVLDGRTWDEFPQRVTA